MLPNPRLAPHYDKVVWVYVYRDFSRNDADRAAERISVRFGVTSWPQLFLADPESLRIVAHTGRSVESFEKAVSEATEKTKKRYPLDAWEKTKAAEQRAKELEARPKLALARKLLDDEDVVVASRALDVLARKDPKAIAKRATQLLEVANDPFRYTVCNVLKAAADPAAARALEALVAEPRDSLNPNVLRIRAVQALATCGDEKSVAVVAPFAQSGAYFNGLTGISIDTLAALKKRHKKARAAVDAALREAYPKPPDDGDARAMRACVALAKRVHKARGDKRPFPKVYDERAREKLASR